MNIEKLNDDKIEFFEQIDDEIVEFIIGNFGDILEDIEKPLEF